MRGFVAHEYVHSVAISIIGDRQRGIPGWSVEGSANFYGFAIAALMADQPNAAMDKVNTNNLRRSYFEQGALIPHSLNKDELFKAVITSEKGGGGDGTTCAEPKIIEQSKAAIPEGPAPPSSSTITQHSARLPRPFVDPSSQTQRP